MSEKSIEELMETLLESLKNKSVYHNLDRILKNNEPDFLRSLIALSSLQTHILIEMEHSGMDFLPLLVEVNSKVQKLIGEF